MNTPPLPKRSAIERQITGLAGEFFVAAELLKHGLQTSVTFGNAKAIDLVAINSRTGKTCTVQVKALREINYFPIISSGINPQHTYIFVLLNKPSEAVQYFIVPGLVLANEQEQFGKGFQAAKFPGIHPRSLHNFKGRWDYFDE
jgi:hypothetical protein